MKKLILVLIVAILVMFLGCSKGSDSPTSPSYSSPIAGTWKETGGFTVVFNSNGTWSSTTTGTTCTGSGTSSTSGNNLTIVDSTESCASSGTTYPKTYTYTYTVTATTLTMTSTTASDVLVFTKQ